MMWTYVWRLYMIRIYNMTLMVKIYEKDMGVIIVKYYDTMA